MADYSHHHTYRAARPAHRSHGRRLGGVLAITALLMAAALVWIWGQQRGVDSPLAHPLAPRAPVIAKSSPALMTPNGVAPVPAAKRAPPSDAVAASGDTRATR
jgi:hypothetical protein